MANQHTIIVALKGLIVNEGKVLIVQRAIDDEIGAGTWECAGGIIEFGEDLEYALLREMKEEVGLVITVEKFYMQQHFKRIQRDKLLF